MGLITRIQGLFSMKESHSLLDPNHGASQAEFPQTRAQKHSAPEPKPVDPATFNECLEAYVRAPAGSGMEAQAIDRFSKLARSTSDWAAAYDAVSPDSKLGIAAAEKMVLLADSVNDIETIDARGIIDIASAPHIVRKAAAKAGSLDDWKRIYMVATKHSVEDVRSLAESKMSETASTWREWAEVANEAESGSTLESLAARKGIEACKTLADKVGLFGEFSADSASEKAVLESIRSTDATFSEWRSALDDNDADSLGEIARPKLVASIKDKDDLVEADPYLGDGFESDLAAALKQIGLPREDLEEAYDDVQSGGAVAEAIMEWLFESASSVSDLVRLHMDCADDMSGDFEDKVFEKIASMATRSELDLISLLAEEGSALETAADRALEAKKV